MLRRRTSTGRDELKQSQKNLIRVQTGIVNQHTHTMEIRPVTTATIVGGWGVETLECC